MKGLCPFHDEKTPSFNVNPSRGGYHCFGCQEGGDVISFLMKIDGLTFVETVERLAEKYGVELKREDGDVRDDRPRGPARGQADRGAPGRAGVLRRAAADAGGAAGPSVPDRARLRRLRGRDLRAGLRAPRRRRRVQAPAQPRLHPGGDRGRRAGGAEPARRVAVRPVPRAAALADPRGQRRDDRLRGAADLRGRPDRREVPQHLRDADLQEEHGALRHRPGPAEHGPVRRRRSWSRATPT